MGRHPATTTAAEGGARRAPLTFSPDGKLVLAVGEDGYARLFDARTGKAVRDVRVGPRKLTAAAFSPDGKRFATAGYEGAVRVFDTTGGSLLLVLRGQLARVFDVGFGPTSDRVVSAGDDGSALWDAGESAHDGRGERRHRVQPGRPVAGHGQPGRNPARMWDHGGPRLRRVPGPATTRDPLLTGRQRPRHQPGRAPRSNCGRRPVPSRTVPESRRKAPRAFGPDGKHIIYSAPGERVVVQIFER